MCHNQAIPAEAQFTLNGSLRELENLAEQTARFCREHALGDDVQYELNLVLEELFVNALRHGGCEGMEGASKITLRIGDDDVRVEFADRGAAFNPLTAPPPNMAAPLEERQNGGLGLHFVRHFMRDLQYRREGEWNRLTMRRSLTKDSK